MKYLKVLIIVAILICAWVFLRHTDLNKVGSSLQQVGFHFIWLLLISASSYICGTIAWRNCMGEDGKHVKLAQLFWVRHVGETVGIINPTSIVAGEALKIYLLRDHPIEKQVVVTSVLLSRVLMMATQLLSLLIITILAFAFVPALHFSLSIAGMVLGILAGVAVFIYLLIVLFKGLGKTRLGNWFANSTEKLRTKVSEASAAIRAFYYTNKKDMLIACCFFMLHWALGSLEFYIILHLLATGAGFIPAMFVDMSVIIFKSAGAFVPAQIGVEEYGNKLMLATVGITAAETWVTASLLRRARQLFWILLGLVAYFFIDRKRTTTLYQNGDPVCKS
ncbi:flippase-like domain-containing protein [Mucilaginibacter sp. UR6-1]|uniref:lysylphosphatidylglycerol synthase transmembrane domain-containing protein n=1 Tax=Mucilaginibacter sp. UR6-1 TaxID=1435643 RepID=UPI001E501B4E|nr:lysylphosphatidylglycerol synthase transmembrane domain-containing protein [Mucilaginibacter sp. UR6-1]MCC8409743.1 flippase-like domain-containing protein [Mucilaginibacter sp. UR6-1]